jgi:hypothetical protein
VVEANDLHATILARDSRGRTEGSTFDHDQLVTAQLRLAAPDTFQTMELTFGRINASTVEPPDPADVRPANSEPQVDLFG